MSEKTFPTIGYWQRAADLSSARGETFAKGLVQYASKLQRAHREHPRLGMACGNRGDATKENAAGPRKSQETEDRPDLRVST